MRAVPRAVRAWFPDHAVARRLCTQTFLYSLALGFVLPANAVYFTREVGLSLQDFGFAFSVASAVAFALAIPLGRVTDRVGSRAVWTLTALAEVLAFTAYPFVDELPLAVVVISVLEIAAIVGNSARMAYSLDVLPEEGRVRALAQTRIWFNIGAAAGGGVAGLVLAVPGGLLWVPLATAAVALVNALAIRRLPPSTARARRKPNPLRSSALADRRFVVLALAVGVVGSSEAILAVVLPSWILTATAMPTSAMGALFVLNTVLVVALQVPISAGAEDLPGASRSARRAALLLAGTCLVAMTLSASRVAWVVVLVAVVAVTVLTASELFYSAARWGSFALLAPVDRRAEYQSVYQLGARAAVFVTPAAATAALTHWGAWGWLPFAGVFVLVGLILPRILHGYEAWTAQSGRERVHGEAGSATHA